MQHTTTLPRYVRVIGFLIALLVVLKAADMFVGWWLPPKSDDRVVRSKRTVTVRLHEPNISVIVRADEEYMRGVDGMQARDLSFRTDDDGFLLGTDQPAGPVDITFLGGSSTVCMYVEEAKRFPALVSQLLRRPNGTPTRTQNGGLNINHTVHSTFNVITTVLPHKPRIVAMMHNDFLLLAVGESYWTGPPMQVFHKPHESLWDPLTAAKRIKELLVPNIWAIARDYVPTGVGRMLRFHSGDEFEPFRGNAVQLDRIKADFRSSLTGAVRYLRAWNIEPVLMTQFNRVELDQDFVRQQYEQRPLAMSWPEFVAAYKAFNDIVRDVANENSVLLIDLDRKVPRSPRYLYNSEHLNDEGSQLVARIIAGEIAARFTEYKVAEQR